MKVIDIRSLARGFAQHAASCASSSILCTVHVAFESWFRLELAYTLQSEGDVSFDYSYEENSSKGDLSLTVSGRKAAFELKSFVSGSDANKFQKFPRQLELIRREVLNGRVAQGVAFCTFIGYKDDKMNALCQKWFPQPWETTGLVPICVDKPLRLALASIEN